MSPLWIFAVAIAMLLARSEAQTAPGAAAASLACNGHVEYCSRRYSNVSQIGAHDSPFNSKDRNNFSANQELTLEEQLDAGVRFLQAQAHWTGTELRLCHTSCTLFDGGNLTSYLMAIKQWLDQQNNSREVLTLLLTNPDNHDPGDFGQAFDNANLTNSTFWPDSPSTTVALEDWPTLEAMIEGDARVVVFMDNANVTEVPFILPEWDYFFETPYDMINVEQLSNNCMIDRPRGKTADGRMYIVNHFLDKQLLPGLDSILIPFNELDNQTNAATGNASIGSQVQACASAYGRLPKAVLVDYLDMGQVFVAERAMNGIAEASSAAAAAIPIPRVRPGL